MTDMTAIVRMIYPCVWESLPERHRLPPLLRHFLV